MNLHISCKGKKKDKSVTHSVTFFTWINKSYCTWFIQCLRFRFTFILDIIGKIIHPYWDGNLQDVNLFQQYVKRIMHNSCSKGISLCFVEVQECQKTSLPLHKQNAILKQMVTTKYSIKANTKCFIMATKHSWTRSLNFVKYFFIVHNSKFLIIGCVFVLHKSQGC